MGARQMVANRQKTLRRSSAPKKCRQFLDPVAYLFVFVLTYASSKFEDRRCPIQIFFRDRCRPDNG